MRLVRSSLGMAVSLMGVACSHGDDGGGTFASIPTPALLVANGGSETVSILDPSTLTVVGSVSVRSGMHPHHVSVAPDGRQVLITATSADLSGGHGGGSAGGGHGGGHGAGTVVYQLDVASRVLRDVLSIDDTAHNAAFTRDGATVALGMMEEGKVVGYDATTFTETFSASGFEMPLEVTPTGTRSLLIAESGASRVALFALDSQTTTARFEVGPVPVAAWASGPASYFVSVEEGKQVRHLTEADTGITLDDHAIDPGGMPGQAVLTPNGKELWVAVEDRAVIAIFDSITHAKLTELAAGTKPHGIVFEPNGQRAFITDEGGGRLLVINVASRTLASEISVGEKPNGIAWLERQP
jgi:YVTN family beta-propeller protein